MRIAYYMQYLFIHTVSKLLICIGFSYKYVQKHEPKNLKYFNQISTFTKSSTSLILKAKDPHVAREPRFGHPCHILCPHCYRCEYTSYSSFSNFEFWVGKGISICSREYSPNRNCKPLSNDLIDTGTFRAICFILRPSFWSSTLSGVSIEIFRHLPSGKMLDHSRWGEPKMVKVSCGCQCHHVCLCNFLSCWVPKERGNYLVEVEK